MSIVIVLGGKAFWRCLGHGGGVFLNEISVFVKQTPERSFPCLQCEHAVRRYLVWSRKWVHTESTGILILAFPDSRTWEINVCYFTHFIVFYIVVWMDCDSNGKAMWNGVGLTVDSLFLSTCSLGKCCSFGSQQQYSKWIVYCPSYYCKSVRYFSFIIISRSATIK